MAAYRQLMEVERSFRLIKSPVIRVRPIFHWTQRRVEAHLFICQLAFLLAKILELKLAELPVAEQAQLSGEAGRRVTATRALTLLGSLKVAQDRWQDWEMLRTTRPTSAVLKILGQLGISEVPRLLSLRKLETA